MSAEHDAWVEAFGARLHERLGQLRFAPKNAEEWAGTVDDVLTARFTAPLPVLPPERRVVAAAVFIKTPNGDMTLSSPPPDRHHNLIGVLNWLGVKPNDIDQAEQGFLLNDGTFANRKQALVIAREAEQIIRRCGGEHALYSENLW